MKTISELLKIIKSLDTIDFGKFDQLVNKHVFDLTGVLQNANYQTDSLINLVQSSASKIHHEANSLEHVVNEYRDLLLKEIQQQEQDYYKKSEDIYRDFVYDTPDYIMQRSKNSLSFQHEEINELFDSRLSVYNRWEFPGMELRPAFGNKTEIIKGCDPLYLVDVDPELFREVKHKWTESYQRRLRYYTVSDSSTQPLDQFPNNQYGLILAVDYFNFKTLEVIQRYLRDGFNKLRPGGTFMFTYNNCDQVYGAKNVENKFCCYTPGSQIVKIAEDIGYKVQFSYENDLENVSWLEIQKPGELTTLRGGQTLGEIKYFAPKPELSDKERYERNLQRKANM